ncbi:response regulator [Marinovum sp. 2_MG-2023]|uniref:response regulator n=1 Tax=Roseobacteraceae TaxID=2854170 RepID=UPI001FD05863|nr:MULTISPECIES: response regulator [Roseobacteraceae]MCJ7874429.1 response regulator [Phaeobacter sp. J2-8]MDO6731240.1 response regulator [Marinovum sp. 2_MG-2023]MDO6780608.1 response regulator [Marinovum sp. 1_MG-2023]
MTDKSRVTFLIVDDDSVAVMAIKRTLRKLRLTNPVEVARDGQEALDLLQGNGISPIKKPYIILLDLNMPRMSGLEFLAVVREDKELANSVVFVLTTSDAPSDIAAAYRHKIAGYIVKENASETISTAISMLDSYTEIVSFDK